MWRQQAARSTVRAPFFEPFDEISIDQKIRPRNKSTLQKFFSNINFQFKKHRNFQRTRLQLLSKVNDRSYDQINQNQTYFTQVCKSIDSAFHAFRPNSTAMLLWNFFMLAAIVFNIFEIPISLFLTQRVYQSQMNTPLTLAINIIFILAFFVDTFFIRFNLAFYRHGKLIAQRKQIFMKYIVLNFWLDLISWLVLVIYVGAGQHKIIYLKILFYFKISTLKKVDSEIQFALSPNRGRFCLYKLFRIILILWFLTTWVSSIYFAIDYHYYEQKGYYYSTGQLWLTNSNAVNNIDLIQTFPKWYIWFEYAVYWSLQTSATIGYGDMTPRNPQQVFYCNCMIILNTVFFAFYINTIWSIIGEYQEYSTKYSQNWTNLKLLMKNQNIPSQLKDKVGNFLQEIWINQTQDIQEEQFVNILSEQLKDEVNYLIKKKFFIQLPIFAKLDQFSIQWTQLVKKLVFKVEKERIGKGEAIYQSGDKDSNLYYLLNGKVELSIQKLHCGKVTKLDSYFGVQQFFTERPRLYNAVSLSFCMFWRISRTQFLEILKKYRHLYQKFCQLQDRIILYNQVDLCQVECLKCGSFGHFVKNCPEINSWRNKIVKPLYMKRSLSRWNLNERKQYRRSQEKMSKTIKPNIYLENKEIFCQQVHIMKQYWLLFNIR